MSLSASEDEYSQERSDLKLAVGTRVQGFFKPEGAAESDGQWYSGKIVSQNAGGMWRVLFEDGEEHDYGGLEADLRLAKGPWESWLDSYVPALLTSAYRAARRDPVRFDRSLLEPVHNPEEHCRGKDAAASCAGTPATAVKRKRAAQQH